MHLRADEVSSSMVDGEVPQPVHRFLSEVQQPVHRFLRLVKLRVDFGYLQFAKGENRQISCLALAPPERSPGTSLHGSARRVTTGILPSRILLGFAV